MQILFGIHTKGDEVPNVNPSIGRQPFNAIGLARIIPMLRLVIHRIYGEKKTSGIIPPPQCPVLDNMIDLESLYPFAFDSIFKRGPYDSNVAECLTQPCVRIKTIGIHQKRRINRHRHALAISGEAQLDRVQVNVAALKGEEEEEAN